MLLNLDWSSSKRIARMSEESRIRNIRVKNTKAILDNGHEIEENVDKF